MSDLGINTNISVNTPMVDTTDVKNTANVQNTTDVQNNEKLLASEPDKFENNVETETPVVTEEMIENLGKEDKVNNEPETLVEHVEKKQEEKKQQEIEKKEQEQKAIEKKEKIEQKKDAEAQLHNKSESTKSKKPKSTKNNKAPLNKDFKVTLRKVNGNWHVDVNKTSQINAYEKNLKIFGEEYRKKYPEPDFSADGSDSESAEHANWNSKFKKEEKRESARYLADCSDDTAEQIRRINNARNKAAELNRQSTKIKK